MMMPRIRIAALLPLLLLPPTSPAQTVPQTAPQSASQTVHPDAAPIQATRLTNCPLNELTHARDCTLGVFTFDHGGADPNGHESAHSTELTTTGPGISLGNFGGWRVQFLNVDELNVANRGIAQGRSLKLNKHATGDTMGTYDYVFSDGGSTALSDEAIKGEAANVGETDGYFHGKIASTTGTGDIAPALTFVSGNNWTTDGAPLLDITKGTISGHLTGRSAPLPGSTYLNTLTVDNELPLSTAWGICNTAIPNNHTAQVNTPFTCNVTLKQGRFRPQGVVCVTGPNYPEQAPITAASTPSGGSQSITIAVRNPNTAGISIFQGGLCGQYISFDANLALTGYRSSYYAFGALDPHHLIYGMNRRGVVAGGFIPMTGDEAAAVGVDGLDGYHLYPGCEVVTNRTFGANPICEPNAVPWATSDLIEAPHNVAVSVTGRSMNVYQNTPSNGWGSVGDLLVLHGPGTSGNNFIGRLTRNANPVTLYKPFGGPLDAPDFHHIDGYFDVGLAFRPAPHILIRVQNNRDTPNTPITLFSLPGGDIRWDPASGSLLAKTGLHGTTTAIGGRPLALGTCATGTATIPGANNTMVPVTVASTTGAPGFSPGGAFQVNAQVTAPDTVTVSVCAILPGTPRPSTYIVSLQ
ncbi:hypothetical protein [Granulicella pectinivorans]|nr:hypothetical protein [Granulicella pectinivorans]